MKAISSLLVLAMILAACDTDTTAESTSSTSTTTASTTSTSVATTATTSTITTTTTTVPPTTTSTLLEGNWAEMPVIVSSSGWVPLGWWDGAQWIDFHGDVDLPIQGGEDFQTALIGTESQITTGSRTEACSPVLDGYPGVRLENPDLLERFVEDDPSGAISGVAISAPWDLTPRSVIEAEEGAEPDEVAIGLLANAGYVTDSVTVVQRVETDLDGDGDAETFAVVEDTTLVDEPMSDVYSLLFATSPSFEEPVVLAEAVLPPGETGGAKRFRVGAIADLNGDGVMEVVIDSSRPRSRALMVHELTDVGFDEVMSAGCGV